MGVVTDDRIVDTDMLIDAVDDQDNVIGTVERSAVFRAKANFRVVHIFLFNGRNELLIQQLSASRDRHPCQWGSSVAGYVHAGESYSAASSRRLRQELGIQSDLHWYGKTAMCDEGSKKFIGLFLATSGETFQCDHQHIAQLEFLPIPWILNLHRTGRRIFTPTFLHTLNFYERRAPSA